MDRRWFLSGRCRRDDHVGYGTAPTCPRGARAAAGAGLDPLPIYRIRG